MDMSVIEDRKTRARSWFERLRDELCAAFENWKTTPRPRSIPAPRAASCARPGTAPTGQPGGGGVMSVMRGSCSRRSACTARRCMANSRPSSARRSRCGR